MISDCICPCQQKAYRLGVNASLLDRRDALPWMLMTAGMNRASAKWVMALHTLLSYKLLCDIDALDLLQLMSYMCINESHERNIPEVMWDSMRLSYLSRCTVAMRIAQVNKTLSQVSTYFSICMTLLRTALKGYRRQEALFQTAGVVS